jgi:retron-type reverse transcriptase
VLSPLLANIYLHAFDEEMTQAGYALVRYADDFVVMCLDCDQALLALHSADALLAARGLRLNPHKTAVLPFGPQFRFLGATFTH